MHRDRVLNSVLTLNKPLASQNAEGKEIHYIKSGIRNWQVKRKETLRMVTGLTAYGHYIGRFYSY